MNYELSITNYELTIEEIALMREQVGNEDGKEHVV